LNWRNTWPSRIWPHTISYLFSLLTRKFIWIAEAGGVVVDAAGKPLDFSRGRYLDVEKGIIATNAKLMPLLLSAVQAALKEEKSVLTWLLVGWSDWLSQLVNSSPPTSVHAQTHFKYCISSTSWRQIFLILSFHRDLNFVVSPMLIINYTLDGQKHPHFAWCVFLCTYL